MKTNSLARIAIADDHTMIREALSTSITSSGKYEVIIQAGDGYSFIKEIDTAPVLPDICVLDINMPGQNGWETMNVIKSKWPSMSILVVTSLNDKEVPKNVFKNGGSGYLCKSGSFGELIAALDSIMQVGYYLTRSTPKLIIDSFKDNRKIALTQNEKKFLKYNCMDCSCKEIAGVMDVSARTVESYRNSLYQKLNVKTRIGLVMYAIKNGIVSMSDTDYSTQ